jgi:hypothetical protein
MGDGQGAENWRFNCGLESTYVKQDKKFLPFFYHIISMTLRLLASPCLSLMLLPTLIKKEDQIFLIYKKIQSGAVAKSYIRKSFLIYEKMRKYFPIYEEAVCHI